MIIERQLLPGEKIPQEKLAEDLGISRTPLVNALKLLEQDKLVQSIPRRGFFVRLFDKPEMISISSCAKSWRDWPPAGPPKTSPTRRSYISRVFSSNSTAPKKITDIRAYAREDRLFHTFLLEVSTKEFLKNILETYNIISYSYQSISSEGLIQSPDDTLHDHRAIIDAISRREAEAAENLMRQHFKKSVAILKQS